MVSDTLPMRPVQTGVRGELEVEGRKIRDGVCSAGLCLGAVGAGNDHAVLQIGLLHRLRDAVLHANGPTDGVL